MADTYVKATNVAELIEGSSVLIVAEIYIEDVHYLAILSTEQSSNNIPAYLIAYTDGAIELTEEMQVLTLVKESTSFAFSYEYKPIETVTIKYYLTGVEGNSNRLRRTSTLSSTCYFNLQQTNDGTMTITCNDEDVKRNVMMYNNQAEVFACYASTFSGIKPMIYIKKVEPEPEVITTYTNHVVDPTFFYDAIELFAFNYDIFIVKGQEIDDYGRIMTQFEKQKIRGSLQSQGVRINRSKQGNIQEMRYDFYCKSLYRIDIGDFIYYKHRWLCVDDVYDFDEYGVRHASLKMVQLANYKDLQAYVKYLQGDEIV